MKLAITSNTHKYSLTLVDTDTEKIITVKADKRGFDRKSNIELPPHLPYGITWSKDKIFIANRLNLLIYDSDLNFVECIDGVLDSSTHQITYYDGYIIGAMMRRDCIKLFNLEDHSSELFHVEKGWGSDFPLFNDGEEKYHVNSITVKDDLCYILLNNFGIPPKEKSSQIVVLNLKTREKERTIETNAKGAHNIYLNGDTIGTISSEEYSVILGSETISDPLWVKCKLRGMAGDDHQIAIGNFPFDSEHYQGFGMGHITIIENNKVKKNFFLSDDISSINDIRRIDGEDFCHHNKYPFPYKDL